MIEGHGDDIYKYRNRIIDNFSSNTWYGGVLPDLVQHLVSSLSGISSYPEPDAASVSKKISNNYGITQESVCVTNGATEAFYLIAQAFKGSRSSVYIPTFSEYADACKLHRHQIKLLHRNTLPGTLSDAQVVWLCNPNNPDGDIIDKKELSGWISRYPDILFVIDQAYKDFTTEQLLQPAETVRFKNVILVHSMTKSYSVPGLRLGYITAHPSLVSRISNCRMPWGINSMALEAALYILSNPEKFKIPLDNYLQDRIQLQEAIGKIDGFTVYNSQTHFFLASHDTVKASDLKTYLIDKHGILIRDAGNFQGLDERFFRITTLDKERNGKLINALKTWTQTQ